MGAAETERRRCRHYSVEPQRQDTTTDLPAGTKPATRGTFDRRWAVIAWAAFALTLVLLEVERRARVLHPASLLFLFLFVASLLPGLVEMIMAPWRLLRGSRERLSLFWAVLATVPAILWTAWGGRTWYQFDQRHNSNDWATQLMIVAGASVMEARAVYFSPRRLETPRLIMFYDDRTVTNASNDAAEMDQHVARMEQLLGLPLRNKIFYVRGPLFGGRHVSFRGLAYGTSESPARYVDRHELAHAVIGQHMPDLQTPTLLSEGWAESQSVASRDLADRAIQVRSMVAQWGPRWAALTEEERRTVLKTFVDRDGWERLFRTASGGGGNVTSWLGELTNSHWYRRDSGAVYSIGGAFVDHVLRRYGAGRFVELYFASRPGNFDQQCARALGADLQTIEQRFWEDERTLAQEKERT